MKLILYYAAECPDTAPFVAELKRLGVEYEAVEVLSSIPNLKQWLRLRDRSVFVGFFNPANNTIYRFRFSGGPFVHAIYCCRVGNIHSRNIPADKNVRVC